MKILNFGSLNIDHVYQVDNFVRPGETISAKSYICNPGGKGLNQSIALARAGAQVYHAGCIGKDGEKLKQLLMQSGVDVSLIATHPCEVTGHAIIEVSSHGENSIVICGGANHKISREQIRATMAKFSAGDFLLIQNEINCIEEIIRAGYEKNMRIFFNPAPMTPDVINLPLNMIDTLIVNEIEAADLADSDCQTPTELLLQRLSQKIPTANFLLTLGGQGAIYKSSYNVSSIKVPAYPVKKIVDTTAAGDTFIGYFLTGQAKQENIANSLAWATQAAGICISRSGAAIAIPYHHELLP